MGNDGLYDDSVEWDDDFEPQIRKDWKGVAERLKERPGKWALIPMANKRSAAMVKKTPAFREGRWQFTQQKGRVYGRFLGPDLDESGTDSTGKA